MKLPVSNQIFRWNTFTAVRTTGWMIVGLAVLRLVTLPPSPELVGDDSLPESVSMIRRGGHQDWIDPEGSRMIGRLRGKKVAWVSGSSILIHGPNGKKSRLPGEVLSVVTGPNGPEFKVVEYYIAGARLLEIYTVALEALRLNSEVIVVALNPLYVFNPSALFGRKQLFKSGVRNWWTVEDWPMQFLLASPSDHFWVMFGQFVPKMPIPDWFQKVHSRKPFKRPQSADENLMFTRPVQFWSYFEVPEVPEMVANNKKTSGSIWQHGALRLSDPENASWNRSIIRSLFDRINRSGVSAIVYLPSVNPALLENKYNMEIYQKVRAEFAALASLHAGDRTLVLDIFPDEILDSIEFHDNIHLRDPGRLPQYMADLISQL